MTALAGTSPPDWGGSASHTKQFAGLDLERGIDRDGQAAYTWPYIGIVEQAADSTVFFARRWCNGNTIASQAIITGSNPVRRFRPF